MVSDARNKTIGEVSTKYNVSLRTLRFYEERGMLAPTRIGTSRLFAPKDIARLELILKAKKLGFSLEDIRALILAAPQDSCTPTSIVESLPVDTIGEQIAQLEKERETLVGSIEELKEALSKRSA